MPCHHWHIDNSQQRSTTISTSTTVSCTINLSNNPTNDECKYHGQPERYTWKQDQSYLTLSKGQFEYSCSSAEYVFNQLSSIMMNSPCETSVRFPWVLSVL